MLVLFIVLNWWSEIPFALSFSPFFAYVFFFFYYYFFFVKGEAFLRSTVLLKKKEKKKKTIHQNVLHTLFT